LQHQPHKAEKPAPPAKSAPLLAALDLGTNNCRLLIARSVPPDDFKVVDSFSRIVRLGEGVGETGLLSETAIERTIAALKICAERIARHDVHHVFAIATEAARQAANTDILIARARDETGIALQVISAEKEADLAALGCAPLIGEKYQGALIFDIGGGSTELVLVDTRPTVPTVLDWHSAPWGVVSLTEYVGAGEGPDGRAAAYARMRSLVAESFAPFAERLPKDVENRRLLGTSGTVTTLASVHLGLASYDRSAIDGLIVPAASMRRISADLASKDLAQRATLPCIGTERADLVVAGCAILEAILDLWPAEQLGVADRGIREGILRRLMGARAL
jgi:exopolyphosphatase / guanosine-5'-triphosphate,3'-diphosphate pyrophosphatase